MDPVPVSIVVPAFNEAHRLPASLPRLTVVAQRIPGAELIVVDDGSTDGTADLALHLLADVPGAQVVRLPWNSGKGTAIRVGVSYARGEAIVFMDADMASDPGDLPVLLAGLAHAEVVLGSRRLAGGAARTAGRRFGSWAFNQVARTLTALDVADTQCGFKAFRAAEAKILLSMARSSGFGFDVEVLAIATSMGYRILEVPVRWFEAPGGSFRVTRHTPAMLMDVVRSRRYRNRARTLPVPGTPPTRIVPAATRGLVPPAAQAASPSASRTSQIGPHAISTHAISAHAISAHAISTHAIASRVAQDPASRVAQDPASRVEWDPASRSSREIGGADPAGTPGARKNDRAAFDEKDGHAAFGPLAGFAGLPSAVDPVPARQPLAPCAAEPVQSPPLPPSHNVRR